MASRQTLFKKNIVLLLHGTYNFTATKTRHGYADDLDDRVLAV